MRCFFAGLVLTVIVFLGMVSMISLSKKLNSMPVAGKTSVAQDTEQDTEDTELASSAPTSEGASASADAGIKAEPLAGPDVLVLGQEQRVTKARNKVKVEIERIFAQTQKLFVEMGNKIKRIVGMAQDYRKQYFKIEKDVDALYQRCSFEKGKLSHVFEKK